MNKLLTTEIARHCLNSIFVYKRSKILYILALSLLFFLSIADASLTVAQHSIQNPVDTFSDQDCSSSDCTLDRAIYSQNLATIIIESQSIKPGDTFPVSIMAAVDEELSAATLDVTYDSTLFEITSCQLDRDKRFNFSDCNTAQPNLLSFSLLALPGKSGTLTLADITFEHIGRSLGAYDLTMDVRTFADPRGEKIPFTQTDSKIKITDGKIYTGYLPIIIH